MVDQNLTNLGKEQDEELIDNPLENYWAIKDDTDLIKELNEKIWKYNLYILSSGIMARLRNTYNQYYAAQYHQGRIMRDGQNGEFRLLTQNHFKSLLGSVLSQITQQKPSWNAKAVNTDTKTQKQRYIAEGVCDYYMNQKHFDRMTKRATEIALVCGHADISLEWDTSLGKEVRGDVENNKVLKGGDVVVDVFDPINCIFDFNYTDIKNCPWRILRRFVNKWDLIAKFPEKEHEIQSAKIDERVRVMLLDQSKWSKQPLNPDVVPVYYFYHEKTAAMPNGRLFVYCGNGKLTDGDLPYEAMPIYRIAADSLFNSGFGWCMAFDLLPMQITYDRVSSITVTNLANFGLSTVVVPKGGGFNLHPNIGGTTVLEVDYEAGMPQALNFTSTPIDAFKFLEILKQNMEIISGVSAPLRGQVPVGVQSGAGMALLASESIVFNTPVAHSYADLLQDIGTGLVSILKLYAKTPRLVEIAGEANRTYLEEFTSNDLSDVFRVEVDLGSALAKTPAGVAQIASDLLKNGQITGAEYVNAIQTSNLNVATEKIVKKEIAIRQENEDLSNAVPCRVIATDDPIAHILGHREVLDDPIARRGTPEAQKVQEVALGHINEHLAVWSKITGKPQNELLGYILSLNTGAMPESIVPIPPSQPQAGGALPGGELPGGQPPPIAGASMPAQPGMPNNPLSDNNFNTITGGGQPLPGRPA
jgi:hypothetical protein